MNKQPILYFQYDSKWKDKPYRVSGESSTIGSAGCGPTCAAMCIETLTGNLFTPVDACNWSMQHGYKALNQGTYYSYFRPQLSAYGIDCKQLLANRIINQPNNPIHEQVKEYLNQGYYVIALMGPGNWTSGGHFILVWDWDSKIRINDPASTKESRINGDPALFKKEVRNYWLVDARKYNKEEKKMDNTPAPAHKEAVDWAVKNGILGGNAQGDLMLTDPLTRQQFCTMLYRFYKKFAD